jgi:hypothetical protein
MDIMNILHFCIKKGLSCDMVESTLCLQNSKINDSPRHFMVLQATARGLDTVKEYY